MYPNFCNISTSTTYSTGHQCPNKTTMTFNNGVNYRGSSKNSFFLFHTISEVTDLSGTREITKGYKFIRRSENQIEEPTEPRSKKCRLFIQKRFTNEDLSGFCSCELFLSNIWLLRNGNLDLHTGLPHWKAKNPIHQAISGGN